MAGEKQVLPLRESLPLLWEDAVRQALSPDEEAQMVVRAGLDHAVLATQERVLVFREGPTKAGGKVQLQVWSCPWAQLSAATIQTTSAGGVLTLSPKPGSSNLAEISVPFSALDRPRMAEFATRIRARLPQADVAVAAAGEEPESPAPISTMGRCECGAPLPATGLFCPACGRHIARLCPACLAAVAPGSAFCVACGEPASRAIDPICARCGGPLVVGSPFCRSCGHAVSETCPECGAPTSPEWAHCPHCGEPLDVEPTGDELADVSVLDAPPPWREPTVAEEGPRARAEQINERGAEAFSAGRYKDARRLFREAVALNPTEPLYLANLASACGMLGLHQEQEEALERARAIDPDDLSVLMALGYMHSDRGDLGAAERAWRRVLELAPDSEEAEEARENLRQLDWHG